jgi:hypothetical protein
VDDARILSGTSGLVRIKGAQLIITREGINGESQSTSGTIKIDVTGDMILDQSQLLTDSDVTPSVITINAGRVVLKGGGQIITETRGEGRGGDVTINAKESVSISGSGFHNSVSFTGDGFVASVAGPFLSGITTQTLGAGDGGNINIRAPVLEVIGGEIKASASNDYGKVQGRAGNITLEVGNLSVIKGGNISSITQGPGKGGNVSITALEDQSSSQISKMHRAHCPWLRKMVA